MGVLAALGFVERAQEGVSNTLDAAALELAILIAYQVNELEAVLLLSGLEVGLGEDLWDAEDPLEARLFQRVVEREEFANLLQGADK